MIPGFDPAAAMTDALGPGWKRNGEDEERTSWVFYATYEGDFASGFYGVLVNMHDDHVVVGICDKFTKAGDAERQEDYLFLVYETPERAADGANHLAIAILLGEAGS